MKQFLAILAITAIALVGCDHTKREDKNALTGMIYSPNGEPLNGGLLGKPTCQEAIKGWFNRVSAASGHITKAAFLDDARTQCLRMDVDHNGYIVSEELDRFREPYRQQPLPAPHRQSTRENSDDISARSGRGHKGKSKSGDKDSGAHSDPSLSLADPVMSADTNLDFKVTMQEFLAQAAENFTRLDINHDGMLDLTEILSLCHQKH